MAKKEIIAEKAAKGTDYAIDEIGEGKPIERVSENDFEEAAKLEEFMHQELTIVVAKDASPGAYDPVPAGPVNGKNQFVKRGVPQKVKRKYVEALARSRVTSYTQDVPDPRKPEVIHMRDNTALTYQFSVIHDPHPNGAEWLQAILDQP